MSEVKVNKISPRSGTGVTLGDNGDTFTVPSGAILDIASGGTIDATGATITGFDAASDEKVKVSSNDTTPGFLNGKLVAGTNITLTEGTDGGNETLTVAGGAGGKVLQRAYVESGALITASSNSIPEDDTIPQNTEGTEVMTLAITPVSATSKLHIFANMFGSHTASSRTGIALFVDTTSNALSFTDSANGGATTMMNTYLQHVLTSGSTSARTYKIRMGGMQNSGTLSFNGQAGGRMFGTVPKSSIIIMEIEA